MRADLYILDLCKFILVSLFVFYIPGEFLLKSIRLKTSPLTYFCLSLVLGLFLSSELFKLSAYLGTQRYLWLFYISSSVFYLILKSHTIDKGIQRVKPDIYSILLLSTLVIVTFIIWYVIFPSGRIYPDGMRFYRANAFDSMNQMAISEELMRPLPRQFPFWTGIPMVGYHVDAFYWRSLLGYLTHIEPIVLYMRLCPLFILNLLLLTVFSVIKEIKTKEIAITSAIAVFFIGDLSWLIPVIDRISGAGIKTVYFGGDILLNVIFNPPLAYGIIALMLGAFFVNESHKRPSFANILLSGYFFGSLFGIKAFFGIILMISLFLLGLYEMAREKKPATFKIFLISAIVALINISGTYTGVSGPVFKIEPLYFPVSIMRDAGYTMPILASFILFIFGNIGIRFPAFFKVASHMKNWRSINTYDRLFLISIVPAFLFTHILTFNTLYKAATFNFYVLFLIIASLYFAEWITAFLKDRTLLTKSSVVCAIILFAMGSTYFSLLGYTPKYNRYKVITRDELEALNFIRQKTEEDAIIIHDRADADWISESKGDKFKEESEGRDSFISSLGARRVVLECSWHVGCGRSIDNFEVALAARRKDIEMLFTTGEKSTAQAILNKYNVSYVWTDKAKDLRLQKHGILKEVFSNESVAIYKVLR